MTHLAPTEPGSVIQADSLLLRTRFGNWVSDGGFVVSDDDLQEELEAGNFRVLFDTGDPDSVSTLYSRVASALRLEHKPDAGKRDVLAELRNGLREDLIVVPRPHVPYGPWGVDPNEADAEYLRSAARTLRNRQLDLVSPFGSNLTATVVTLLENSATALEDRA